MLFPFWGWFASGVSGNLRMRIPNIVYFALAGLGLAFVGSGAASAGDDWQFEVTPYFLAASLDGTAGARGVEADIDASFSDIWDNLDAGFMGLFTARKGPLLFGLEGVYFKLEDQDSGSVSGPFGKVDDDGAMNVTSEMYIFQGSAGYRVIDAGTSVDLLGAARYTKLEGELEVKRTTTPGIVFPGGETRVDDSESWTDFVVGVHALHPVSDTVALLGYADVGAGGSDLTYQFMLGANWEFRKDYTAKVGYRELYWDYDDDGTVWDMTARGAYLGLGIRF